MIKYHELAVFGKHIADIMRYSIRGTSIYKPEEACDTVEKMVQEVANELRFTMHENNTLLDRIKFLEKKLGISA